MNREFWVDGFNFFHQWESTRSLLRPDSGVDIVRAIQRSLGIFSRHIGSKSRYTIVYLDGGLSRHESRVANMRVRYCGPGKKADDRLLQDLGDLGDNNARLVTAVSNDRELKAALRAYGASCLGVSEFLAVLEGKKKGNAASPKSKTSKKDAQKNRSPISKGTEAEIMREKTRTLSESEVRAWLEFFGEEDGE